MKRGGDNYMEMVVKSNYYTNKIKLEKGSIYYDKLQNQFYKQHNRNDKGSCPESIKVWFK